jgi:hypothetical protein
MMETPTTAIVELKDPPKPIDPEVPNTGTFNLIGKI